MRYENIWHKVCLSLSTSGLALGGMIMCVFLLSPTAGNPLGIRSTQIPRRGPTKRGAGIPTAVNDIDQSCGTTVSVFSPFVVAPPSACLMNKSTTRSTHSFLLGVIGMGPNGRTAISVRVCPYRYQTPTYSSSGAFAYLVCITGSNPLPYALSHANPPIKLDLTTRVSPSLRGDRP